MKNVKTVVMLETVDQEKDTIWKTLLLFNKVSPKDLQHRYDEVLEFRAFIYRLFRII